MSPKPTKLAIFDVDGTLTDTNFVDGVSCIRSTAEVMGQDTINTDLSHYLEITHSAIASQLWQEELQREIEEDELAKLETQHLKVMQELYDRDSSRFCEIAGARSMLAALVEHADWTWGVATGSWRAATEFKLANSGFDAALMPQSMATAGDTFRRYDIIDLAHQRAREITGVGHFDRVVYVGDGTWDAKAAGHLGLPFIGRQDVPGAAENLMKKGALAVVPDYEDFDQFMNCLEGVTG